MKHCLALLLFLWVTSISIVSAQDYSQNVRGTVSDKDSRMTLPGATVMLFRDTVMFAGTTTNEEGTFRLSNITFGRYTLRVSYMGYKDVFLPNILVSSGKEVVLQVQMETSIASFDEVNITATRRGEVLNEMSMVSSRSFTIEETERYSGSRGDPARMASNYAGVRGADDSRNDIVIRGNSPLGVIWRLDGIDIPNPNHFAIFGSTGGPVSILNNKILANSDFMTGAFPAEYGNGLAGVFDLRMRPGNNEKREHTVLAGFLGMEAMTEGPFSKKGKSSYLVSYRYSTMELFHLVGIRLGISSVPKYQDMAFKLNFPVKKGNISVFGLGGVSDIVILDEDRDTSDFSFSDYGKDVYFGSSMGIAGMNWTHQLNDKMYGRLSLAGTYTGSYARHDLLRDTADFSEVVAPYKYLRNNYLQLVSNPAYMLNVKLNNRNMIRAGGGVKFIYLDVYDSGFSRLSQTLDERLKVQSMAPLANAYIQWTHKINDGLTINSGLHYLHFLYNNTRAPEPRLALKWNFSEGQVLSLGYGMHHQVQPIYVYDYKVMVNGNYEPVNKNLDFTRSQHFIVGYDLAYSRNLRFKFETYLQLLDNIPVYKDSLHPFSILNRGADFSLIKPEVPLANTGKGKNYGIELTAERFYTNGFFLLFTGSLYNSLYTGSDGIERPTSFNGNYSFNALTGREITLGTNHQSILRLSGKLTLAGGNRFTPLDESKSDFFETHYHADLTNTGQFNDYMRTDMKIGFIRNAKKLTHEVSLDLVNFTNRKNALTQTYNPILRKTVDEEQLRFFPVLYYKLDF